MRLGEKELRVVDVIAAILRQVVNEALSLSGGEPPTEIRLTHPARWGQTRLEKFGQAAAAAGIENPRFVPEPVAAAVHFATERLSTGEHVAVYDLGGGTFDTAILERTEESFVVVGRPGGDEELGGEDFDDLLYRHLGEQLDGDTWYTLRNSTGPGERAWPQANRELLRHAKQAKEGLSRHSQYEFYLPQPIDHEFLATAQEFERLIGPTLRGTGAELERTILAAGLQPAALEAIYLAGGSSRIPLVGRIIQERLGVVPNQLDDPKAVIALGAARLGASPEAPAETRLAMPTADAVAGAPVAPAGPETVADHGPPQPERTIAGAQGETRQPASGNLPSRPSRARPEPVAPTASGSAGAPPGHAPAAAQRPPSRPRTGFMGSEFMETIRDHKALSIVALLVLAGAIAGGVALLGGGSSSTESALAAILPGNTYEAAHCKARKPASPHVTEEAVCSPSAGTFKFDLFEAPDHRDEAYDQQVQRADNTVAGSISKGSCQDPSEWNRKGSWYHDYPTNSPEEKGGSVICYNDKAGSAHLIWTYDAGPLLAEGSRPDASSHGALLAWHKVHAHDFTFPASMQGSDTGMHH
jgi:hypothetical protein